MAGNTPDEKKKQVRRSSCMFGHLNAFAYAEEPIEEVMAHRLNENTPFQRLGLNNRSGHGVWFSLWLNNLRKHPLPLFLTEAA